MTIPMPQETSSAGDGIPDISSPLVVVVQIPSELPEGTESPPLSTTHQQAGGSVVVHPEDGGDGTPDTSIAAEIPSQQGNATEPSLSVTQQQASLSSTEVHPTHAGDDIPDTSRPPVMYTQHEERSELPQPTNNQEENPVSRRRRQPQSHHLCCAFKLLAGIAVISMAVFFASPRLGTSRNEDNFNLVVVATLPFNVSSIVTDAGHSCAILGDTGQVQCWGTQIGVPSNLEPDPSTRLVVGDGFTCSLQSGQLQCWGDDRSADYVQPPSDLVGPVDFVTASGGTVCAISHGQGRCWGFYQQGRVELTIPASGPLLSIATPKRGELQRVCGVLQDNGRLECWKSDMEFFVLDEISLRGIPSNATKHVQSVAVMQDFVCTVYQDASLSCWAFEDTPADISPPSLSSTFTYSEIIPGLVNSFCVLRSDGQPTCFGTSRVIHPSVGLLRQLSIGANHMCGIQIDSSYGICWGSYPRPGELQPLLLAPLYAKQVSLGVRRTCSVDWYRSMVDCWGIERFQLVVDALDVSVGDEVTCVVDRPNQFAICVVGQVAFALDVEMVDRVIVSRHDDTVCTMAANQVQCFRVLCQRVIYQNFLTCRGVRDFVGNPDSALGLVTALELNQHHYCSIDLEGHIQCGLFDLDQSSTTYPQARVPDDVDIVVDMALGEFFTCVVQNDFTVRCWGEESQYGQEFVLDTPQGGYYRAIAATDNEVCAITLDDFVHCWGRPFSNALYIPEEVSFVTQLTAGSGHFCALMENQEVICWGSNRFGELSPEYYG